jgi:hypothetical protein
LSEKRNYLPPKRGKFQEVAGRYHGLSLEREGSKLGDLLAFSQIDRDCFHWLGGDGLNEGEVKGGKGINFCPF